jgi:hypothetical protein
LGGLALSASAQQLAAPQQQPQAQPAQPAQGQKPRPFRYVRAAQIQARALQLDMAGAGRQALAPINQRGRQLNLKFIAANQAEIDKTSVPVLLPTEPPLAAHLRIFTRPRHYAASSESNGMSFHMTGHGQAFDLGQKTLRRLPGAALRARIPADGVVIERTEAGVDASFSRYGAAYSVSLECADPADRRCADEAFIRGMIARLMVVVPGARP